MYPSVNWSLLGLTLTLVFPSTAVVQKYLGLAGVIVYLGIVSCLLWFGQKAIFPKFIGKVPQKWAILLGALSLLVLAAVVLVLYPLANSGVLGGGSDGDDALNIAVSALLDGQYPYYVTTYLHNSISPLPGSLFLAIPFVLLGSSAYQNIFWLILFFVSVGVYLNSASKSLLLLWTLLLLCPALLYALVVGSDYVANGLYVLLFSWWLIALASQPGKYGVAKVLLAVLLGIGLSSRVNFVLILPLVFSSLNQRIGRRAAATTVAIVVVAFVASILPFLLYDPRGFSPLNTYAELGKFDALLPWAGLAVPLLTLIAALALSFQRNAVTHVFFRNCTLVLALPVLCGTILRSIQTGRLDFGFATFGVMFLFFGAVAFWPEVVADQPLGARVLAAQQRPVPGGD